MSLKKSRKKKKEKKKAKEKRTLNCPFGTKRGNIREREAVSIFIYSFNVYEFSRVSCHLDLTLGSPGVTMIFFFFVFLLHIER